MRVVFEVSSAARGLMSSGVGASASSTRAGLCLAGLRRVDGLALGGCQLDCRTRRGRLYAASGTRGGAPDDCAAARHRRQSVSRSPRRRVRRCVQRHGTLVSSLYSFLGLADSSRRWRRGPDAVLPPGLSRPIRRAAGSTTILPPASAANAKRTPPPQGRRPSFVYHSCRVTALLKQPVPGHYLARFPGIVAVIAHVRREPARSSLRSGRASCCLAPLRSAALQSGRCRPWHPCMRT